MSHKKPFQIISQQSTCGLISLKNRGLPALNFVSESHNQAVYSCNTAITFLYYKNILLGCDLAVYSCNTAITFLFLPSHFPSNTFFTPTRHVE